MHLSRVFLFLIAVVAVATLGLTGCGDEKDACEACTNSSECRPDLTCQQFTMPGTGETQLLCGDDNPFMTCNVS